MYVGLFIIPLTATSQTQCDKSYLVGKNMKKQTRFESANRQHD